MDASSYLWAILTGTKLLAIAYILWIAFDIYKADKPGPAVLLTTSLAIITTNDWISSGGLVNGFRRLQDYGSLWSILIGGGLLLAALASAISIFSKRRK